MTETWQEKMTRQPIGFSSMFLVQGPINESLMTGKKIELMKLGFRIISVQMFFGISLSVAEKAHILAVKEKEPQ